jgi:hypothetical protein
MSRVLFTLCQAALAFSAKADLQQLMAENDRLISQRQQRISQVLNFYEQLENLHLKGNLEAVDWNDPQYEAYINNLDPL